MCAMLDLLRRRTNTDDHRILHAPVVAPSPYTLVDWNDGARPDRHPRSFLPLVLRGGPVQLSLGGLSHCGASSGRARDPIPLVHVPMVGRRVGVSVAKACARRVTILCPRRSCPSPPGSPNSPVARRLECGRAPAGRHRQVALVRKATLGRHPRQRHLRLCEPPPRGWRNAEARRPPPAASSQPASALERKMRDALTSSGRTSARRVGAAGGGASTTAQQQPPATRAGGEDQCGVNGVNGVTGDARFLGYSCPWSESPRGLT